MQPVISFQNYTFRYKSQSEPTLRNINLDIQSGEKIWIAGPSGSGKSTLAHCINGLIPFSYGGESSGILYVGGKEAAKLSIFELSRHVGTILQDQDAQFVGLSVGEDVAFQMENEQVPHSQMKQDVYASLTQVGMEEFESQGPQDLSGGQKQSVSLAGILSTEADILLFDEPLANLDPASGARAMKLIDHIHQSTGKTIIIIEHRVEDVLQQPIDRIIVMSEGEIVRDQTPDQLLAEGALSKYGLRQPLHLQAMKYAGITMGGMKGLSDPEGNVHPSIGEELNAWAAGIPFDPPHVEGERLLELDHLTFGYDKSRPVIKDVSLTLSRGETVALLGNNGAGKSTLSGLITGIYKPDRGEIRYRGESIASWSIRKRGAAIGYVMQNPNHMITQHLIRDEVSIGLRARGITGDEMTAKTDEALRTCGLYPYRNWPVSALSYGQKKRLSIASILVLKPEIMILDEPTAGQDYKHYKEFMDFIHQLAGQGMAFIFITHDMHLALEYASRAVVLSGGEIIAANHVANVLSNPVVTKKAHLREVSLSRFAKAQQLQAPERFVQAFVDYEKRGMQA
ncbi:energy-coupling factor transport system ATP-binding protein [Paenibacillus shirakamiensis]|uniref:Energy-coupling factor transport system ATP-binding protein n=1 Tax=Paenibacillus shirakamiensis TaxID=1265935 RepID=A0ABS4JJG9_9BACL|nr:ABC transporter ATP-binding protein [Paenibacillus shirakamiensis]MBP2001842.1 energy-coupling factor transport system ATP-binding protein [Paenibacillus shirakamiensis]